MREVTVLAAGGTISSVGGASSGPGATPQLDAAALVAGLPPGIEVQARTLRSVNGPQLTNDDALVLATAAVAETEQGRGVVLTSGTDTIEEVAMLCEVLCGDGAPIVVTGAIRPADAPGADGPANLLDAVCAAASPVTEGAGGLVCFAGELHAARTVRKIDSTAPHAFASPRSGPIARIAEGRVDFFARPQRGPRVPMPTTLEFWTPIVTTWLGDDGSLLRSAVNTDPDGLVLVGLGAGHLPPRALAALRECGDGLPVVFVVRPERGHLLRETYGYEGSERDVLATGVIEAAGLSGPAARMLLLAGLGAGLAGDDLRALFAVGA
ncbi:MAG: Asparaginase/glutaminase [Solirubrobacterales bacterium]|nr:Asparaginase/glutaminase [Solirubrobacterales bacterium]